MKKEIIHFSLLGTGKVPVVERYSVGNILCQEMD